MEKGVLIIGGGIAGVQAALDLANSGAKVYLVEKSPSLGGRMAQLDKTFPTNDCAQCILSPKLVEASRHPNIELMTLSEVVKLKGHAGDFKATILQQPRFVDLTKCVACGECTKVCTVPAYDEFNQGLAERNAVYIPFPQAVPLKYSIQKRGKSPCKLACPTKTNAQGYVALIRNGKFREALELVKKAHPFPGICGRVCTHPCEQNCKRGELDEALAISALKRFIADLEVTYEDAPILPKPKEQKAEKVAIIGGGPAGLTCAYNLTLEGYHTTVFEALPVLGGMMLVGIPSYRLPREVINREIEAIIDLGVEVKLNTPIGQKISLEDLQNEYDAIFIAAGAHKPFKLGIFGEDLEGVHHGVTFMRNVNLKESIKIGEKVAVIGGGNTAMDCARSARRLGAKEVYILYRRSRKEMPVDTKEVEEAIEEGVKFHFLTSPSTILTDDGKTVSKIKCVKMKLGDVDESGRSRPIPIPGSEFEIIVDTVIPAVSQAPDVSFLPEEAQFEMTKWDRLAVNPVTLMTSQQGIFAGGDFATGPSSIIKSIAAGERAAIAIDKYIQGVEYLEKEMMEEDLPDISQLVDINEVKKERRKKVRTLDIEKRISTFDEVELGFTEEEAVTEAQRCLNCGICSECLECVKVCEAEAIDHEMKTNEIEIPVGSIIVATGFDLIDPDIRAEFGYSRFQNVITAMEFERILSASGPTGGKVIRPSDGKIPKHISFIQCYGSRDEHHGCSYCSRVCCMYAIKEAQIAKEHEPGIHDITIHYIDLRAYGKGFEEYYTRAKDENAIKFIRGRPAEVTENPDTKDLLIKMENTETGEVDQYPADLMVLASAIIPSKGNIKLSEVLKINLDPKEFFGEKQANVGITESSRDGIYICGCAQGPKDIPDSVAQASGAAALAGKWIKDDRRVEVKDETIPLDSTGDPRIGIFVCHCGSNIAGVVDVVDVREYAKNLPNVVYVEDNLYTCSEVSQKKIQEAILEHSLNRVIVASCSPRTHEPIFRDTVEQAGLNPYLFEMANIRDQCSWIHTHDHEKATLKSKELVKSAAAKSALLEPLILDEIEIEGSALVIGGGISGLTAALALDAQGFGVYLVEKSPYLGGRLADLGLLAPEFIPSSEILYEKYRKLKNSNVKLLTNSKLNHIDGFIGNFKVSVSERKLGIDINKCDLCGKCEVVCPVSVPDDISFALERERKAIGYKVNGWPDSYAIDFDLCDKCGKCVKVCPNEAIDLDDSITDHEFDIGTIILAIGSDLYRPKKGEFGFGEIPNVITNLDMEQLMNELGEGEHLQLKGKKLKKVALIHCVGSRDPENYSGCSRYCCHVALKQANELRRLGVEVVDYYRDIRAFDKDAERIYLQARMKGVIFFRYTPENKPMVFQDNGRTKITVMDDLFGQNVELSFDAVVLSTGMRAKEKETQKLQEMLKIPRGSDGFFLERHPKLGPVETNTDGIYLCGCAQYPKNIADSVSQALGAAAKAAIPMAKKKIRGEGIPSVVNKDICTSCGTCIVVCPYGAISKDEDGKAFVNPTLCKGCGICRATCPEKAILAPHFTRSELLAQIDALSEGIIE